MNEVKGKAKNLFAISGRRFQIPSFLYIDHASLSEALRTIPAFDARRQKCAMNVDHEELRSIMRHLSQSPAPAPLRAKLSTLLKKNRNKKWIVRSSFGLSDKQDETISLCFKHEVISAASAHDLGCAIMRVSSSIFDPECWTRVLSTGQNPARCELGVIVQEFVEAKISGTAYQEYTAWNEGKTSSLARFEDAPPPELALFWRQLKRGMRTLMHRFKSSVRVEWAFDGHRLWWLEVNAVTVPSGILPQHSLTLFSANPSNVIACFPRVQTPMGWSLLDETLENSRRGIFILTGLRGPNAGKTSLLNDVHRDRFAFKTIMQILIPAIFHFLTLIPTLLGSKRSHFRARLLHRVFLNKTSRKVLERCQAELEKHLSSIREFETNVSTFEQCLPTLQGFRMRQMEYFKSFAAIRFLETLNANLVSKTGGKESEGVDFKCSDVQQMDQNASALSEAANNLCLHAKIYLEKSQTLLDSIGKLLVARGVIDRSDDLFHLTSSELQSFLEQADFSLKYLVSERSKCHIDYQLERTQQSLVNDDLDELASAGEISNKGQSDRAVFFADECVMSNAV